MFIFKNVKIYYKVDSHLNFGMRGYSVADCVTTPIGAGHGPLTLTFNPRRATATHTNSQTQVEGSVDTNDRAKTNGQTNAADYLYFRLTRSLASKA